LFAIILFKTVATIISSIEPAIHIPMISKALSTKKNVELIHRLVKAAAISADIWSAAVATLSCST
jgi:hypothetical protein